MPQEKGATKKQQNKTDKNIKLSIMVVNMNSDNASPLRRLCSNLEEYNIKNEYLLNSAKNDIYLVASDNTIKYPVYYAFENNYNAFPFETINVGYAFKNNETKKMKKIKLVYIDRIFSNDSIFFNLNLNQ